MTGPKISSRGNAHVEVHLVEDSRCVERAAGVVAFVEDLAAGKDFGALGLTDLDIIVNAVELVRFDDGADLSRAVRAGAHLEDAGLFDERVGELRLDALLDDDPRRCRAPLAGGAERAPERALDREVDAGVVENDNGVLPPSSHETRFISWPAAAGDKPPRLGRARERYHADPRMLDDCRARLLAESGDEVDDALWNPGIDEQVDERGREAGRVLRRLEDDGIAREQRREHLPAWDCDREVPRGDQTGDTDRDALGEAEDIGALRRHDTGPFGRRPNAAM